MPDSLSDTVSDLKGSDLERFTTVTTSGTARDITVAELAVELFFPADTATAEALRGSDPARAG